MCRFFLAALVLFFSCKKEERLTVRELDEVQDQKLIQFILESGDEGIPFPDGAEAYETSEHQVIIKLPKGLKFAMADPRTNFIIDDGGDESAGVTCTCSSGTGCSPVKFRKKYYCVMADGCSVCSKTVTASNKTPVNIIGLLNEERPVTFAVKTKVEGLEGEFTSPLSMSIGSPGNTLFEAKQTRKDLTDLYKLIYDDSVPDFIANNTGQLPPGYSYVAVNLYGYLVGIPIPNSNVKPYHVVFAGETCKCNDAGGSGCTKKSYLGAVYCEAGNCKSCSLKD